MTAYCGPLVPLQDAGGAGVSKTLWVSSDGETLCAKGVNVQPFPGGSGPAPYGIYSLNLGKQIAGLCAAPSGAGVWIRFDDATTVAVSFSGGVTVYP